MEDDNVMVIDGHTALIKYDPEIELYRGEFIGLTGGADFYAENIEGLRSEAQKSLQIYLEALKKRGISPKYEQNRTLERTS